MESRPDAGGRDSCGTTAPSSPHRGRLRPTFSAQCPQRPLVRHAPAGASEPTSQLASWLTPVTSGRTTSACASRAALDPSPAASRSGFPARTHRRGLRACCASRGSAPSSPSAFPTDLGSSVSTCLRLRHVGRRSWIPRKGSAPTSLPVQGTQPSSRTADGEVPDLPLEPSPTGAPFATARGSCPFTLATHVLTPADS